MYFTLYLVSIRNKFELLASQNLLILSFIPLSVLRPRILIRLLMTHAIYETMSSSLAYTHLLHYTFTYINVIQYVYKQFACATCAPHVYWVRLSVHINERTQCIIITAARGARCTEHCICKCLLTSRKI
jgi:hypothetical protein